MDERLPGAGPTGAARALLGSLLRPHRWAVAGGLLLVLTQNVAELAGPLLIALAIDDGLPAAVRGVPATLVLAVAGYLITVFGSAGLRAAFSLVAGRVGQNVLLELRRRVFRHAQRLSLDFHESYTSGRLISRLTGDLDDLNRLVEEGLGWLLTSVLAVVGGLAVLIWLDLGLAAVVLIGFVPLAVLARDFRRRAAVRYARTTITRARVIVALVETLNGIRAVQGFRRERRNDAIMRGLNDAQRDATASAERLVAVSLGGVRLFGALCLAAVLLVGGWRVIGGGLGLGILVAALIYVGSVFEPMDELAEFADAYAAAAAALEKISGVLGSVPSIAEPRSPQPLPAPVRGALGLDRVRFSYPRAPDRTVLPSLSLQIPAGQTVALVGATGAGKSTVAKLLVRLHDPSSGAVTLDGVDLRAVADVELRRAIVLLTQEPFLFSGSVADNIALGVAVTRTRIEQVATAVGAAQFIAALPDGYDTDVRKRGGRLSAGQRQLVGLARVLLADPAVIVLDEATSLLDLPAERAVQAALRTVLAGRTAVIIAHRLSTVLDADRVLVMADGQIVEDGAPAALLGNGGEFAGLHAAWQASLAH